MNDYYYIINSIFKIKKSITFVHLKEISFFNLILILSERLALALKASFFYYSVYFCYYLRVPLHFLVLFIGVTVLF